MTRRRDGKRPRVSIRTYYAPMAERDPWFMRVLDSRFLARLRAALFIGTVLVPAAAALVTAVVLIVAALTTRAGWVPLLFGGLGLFLVLWWLVARASKLIKRSMRSSLSLEIGGAVFGERNQEALVQLTVKVRNESAPTTIYQWRLAVEANGDTYSTRHVVGEAPLYRSLDVPMLDKAIGNTPLNAEITGLLQFAVPGVSQQQLLDALDRTDQPMRLTLAARSGTGGSCQTESDLRALKAKRHEIVQSQPPGPSAMVEASRIGTADLRRNRGHMVRAGGIGKLIARENVGPGDETQTNPGEQRIRWSERLKRLGERCPPGKRGRSSGGGG
jgi:hypothetical protein